MRCKQHLLEPNWKFNSMTATAGMLRLSRTDDIAEVQRDRVVKIYQLFPKPDELRRLLRNAGTITGVAGGLEIAKNKRAGFFLIPAVGGAGKGVTLRGSAGQLMQSVLGSSPTCGALIHQAAISNSSGLSFI